MAFVSSLCQTKSKGMPECNSQRLCGLVMLSKFAQSSKQTKNSKRGKKEDKICVVFQTKKPTLNK